MLTLADTIRRFIAVLYNLIFGPRVIPNSKNYNVVIIGAGFSGLGAAVYLKKRGFKNYTILEKYDKIGGTWLEAKYPGVKCDINSHFYSWSFNLKRDWTQRFSSAEEIWEYMHDTAKKFDIYKSIKFGTHVESATWDEEKKMWKLVDRQGRQYTANFLINGTGALNKPVIPKFKNIDKFKGPNFHTFHWDDSVDLKGKRVGVVGTGASSVQLVPAIQDQVKDLHVFQRTPCWCPPRFGGFFTAKENWILKNIPGAVWLYRVYTFLFYETGMFVFVTLNERAETTKKIIAKIHKRRVKDPDLAKKLTPDYMPGCKRMTPSDTYLRAFNKENVHLQTDAIQEITDDGILLGTGEEIKLDVIVWATGFSIEEAAFGWLKVYGRGGIDPSQSHGDTPASFMGICNYEYPNYFRTLGPNTALTHNSVLFMIECQLNFICEAIKATAISKKKVISPKPDSLPKYMTMIRKHMANKAFSERGGCLSYYRNARGVNWTLWPRSTIVYWWYTLTFDRQYFQFD